jgi:nucleoid DNA-binding protein
MFFMPLTQSQLVATIAEETELSKSDVKNVLLTLEDVVLTEINNAEKVKIGSIVQLTPKVKPATKARKGRNPATGEEITISAKPASVQLKARPLARAKASLPSVQKAKKRLGA